MRLLPAIMQHRFIGKSGQKAPYHMVEHLSYITRNGACEYTYSYKMPRGFHRAAEWIRRHEDGLRKNGRVGDKLTLTLAYGTELKHAQHAAIAFGMRAGQGRAPFYVAIHDFNSENPHAHIIFFDRDYETGERVFGTTKRGSTERLKGLWTKVQNDVLEKHGYDVRVADMSWEQIRALEHDNDNALECPEMPLEADNDNLQQEELEPEGKDVAFVYYGTETLQGAIRAAQELDMLRTEREALSVLREALTLAESEAERIAEMAEEIRVQAMEAERQAAIAEATLDDYRKANGKLKGFGIKIGPWELKTSTRHEAEKAQAAYDRAEQLRRYADKDRQEAELTRQRAERAVEEMKSRQQKLEHQLATRGTEAELDQAEQDFENTKNVYMEGVTVERLQEAYQNDEISEGDYLYALNMMGERELVEEHEKGIDR